MPLLFAAAPAIVPCLSVSALACRCCCRRCCRRRWMRLTDSCRRCRRRRHPPAAQAFAVAPFSVWDRSCCCRRCHCHSHPAATRAFAVVPFFVWDRSCCCRRCRCQRHPAAVRAFSATPFFVRDCSRHCRCCRHQRQQLRRCHRLLDIFLLLDLNRAAGSRRHQPIIVTPKLSLPPPPPISSLSLSCLWQPSFLAISGLPLLLPFLVCGRHPVR